MTRAVITILASVLASSTAVRAQDGTFVLVDSTRVSSIHASTDGADAYAVTFEGQLLRSRDSGMSWHPVHLSFGTDTLSRPMKSKR